MSFCVFCFCFDCWFNLWESPGVCEIVSDIFAYVCCSMILFMPDLLRDTFALRQLVHWVTFVVGCHKQFSW